MVDRFVEDRDNHDSVLNLIDEGKIQVKTSSLRLCLIPKQQDFLLINHLTWKNILIYLICDF